MIIERIFKEVSKHDFNDISDNPDREYMEECAKVDENRPETWKPYENYPMGIIDMEYNELRAAKTLEDKIENLYHLSVGCLNMWRHLKKNN
jgi:hypothetical protein